MRVLLLVLTLSCLGAQDPASQAVSEFIRQLDSDNIEARVTAENALVALGEKAKAPIQEQLPTLSPEARIRCKAVLRRIEEARLRFLHLPPVKRINVRAVERDVKDVLREVEKKSGYRIDISKAGNRKISLDFKGAYPLEAVDAVLAKAELGFGVAHVYSFNQTSKRTKRTYHILPRPDGHRDLSVTYIRQYRVAAAHANVGASEGKLGIRLRWHPDIHAEDVLVTIRSIRDDKGRELYDRAFDAGQHLEGIPPSEAPPRSFGNNTLVHFRPPAGNVRRIASVTGRVILRIPVGKDILRINPSEKSLGQSLKIGAGTITLTGYSYSEKGIIVTFRKIGQWRRPPNSDPNVYLGGFRGPFLRRGITLKSGRGKRFTPRRSRFGNTEAEFEFECVYLDPKLRSLEMDCATEYFHDSFDFELKDIHLTR